MQNSIRKSTVHRFYGCSVNHRLAGDRGLVSTLLHRHLPVLTLELLGSCLQRLRRVWHGRRPVPVPVRVR